MECAVEHEDDWEVELEPGEAFFPILEWIKALASAGDERLVPDHLRGRCRSISGDLNVGNEGSEFILNITRIQTQA
jgi:hypothetical protein